MMSSVDGEIQQYHKIDLQLASAPQVRRGVVKPKPFVGEMTLFYGHTSMIQDSQFFG